MLDFSRRQMQTNADNYKIRVFYGSRPVCHKLPCPSGRWLSILSPEGRNLRVGKSPTLNTPCLCPSLSVLVERKRAARKHFIENSRQAEDRP